MKNIVSTKSVNDYILRCIPLHIAKTTALTVNQTFITSIPVIIDSAAWLIASQIPETAASSIGEVHFPKNAGSEIKVKNLTRFNRVKGPG